jgi:hypothetical protein
MRVTSPTPSISTTSRDTNLFKAIILNGDQRRIFKANFLNDEPRWIKINTFSLIGCFFTAKTMTGRQHTTATRSSTKQQHTHSTGKQQHTAATGHEDSNTQHQQQQQHTKATATARTKQQQQQRQRHGQSLIC